MDETLKDSEVTIPSISYTIKNGKEKNDLKKIFDLFKIANYKLKIW